MSEQDRSGGDMIREGIRTALGILGAIKDEVEAQIDDLKTRDEFSPEKAKETVRRGMDRAQGVVEELRERVDFVTRREYDELRAEIAELRARIDALQASLEPPPEIPFEVE
jgi:polyhydroxyalkanoate synthesis regulator phasin